MSESDPRFHSKKSIDESGTAIVVSGSEKSEIEYVKEDYERSEWVGGSSTEDKIGRALEVFEKGESFILPLGMTMEDIKTWVPKAATTLNKNKVLERKLGRTGIEVWAFPTNYAVLEGSMGTGGGLDSLSDVGNRGINVAELVYDEISIHGRETIDEVCRNIQAIDPQLITVIVNTMLQDRFLQLYTEEDGLKTLELVEAVTRNRSLGYTPSESIKELENLLPPDIDPQSPEAKRAIEEYRKERHIGGTQRVEDNVPVIDATEGIDNDREDEYDKPIKDC